jgi:hypothetical protein
MTHDIVSMLARSLCRAFPDDPALQRALLAAKEVDDVMAALSHSADAAFELQKAATADTETAKVARENARAAAVARQRALRIVIMAGPDTPAPEGDRGSVPARPSLRVVTSSG